MNTMTTMARKSLSQREGITLGFPCPTELQNRIDRYARRTDRSRAQVIRLAIRLGLTSMERSRSSKKK